MRFPFRAVLIGLLVGALIYFAPFRFPFLFFFLFIFLISRFFFWGRWRRGYWYGRRWGYAGPSDDNDITPIDGGQPLNAGPREGERKINIR